MTERRFDIIFDGSIINGADILDVKSNVQSLFKLNDSEIERMFSGQPIAIKKNLDRQKATQYQTALTQAGAKIQLILHQSASSNHTKATTETTTVDSTPEGLFILPVGSDLLKENERSVIKTIDVDISHLSLDISSEELNPFLTAGQTSANTAVDQHANVGTYPLNDNIEVTTSLTVADVGEQLATTVATQPVDINTDHLTARDVGQSLLEDNERAEITADAELVNLIENSQLSVANTGSDLLNENERPAKETNNIDTSQLSISDSS